MRVVKSGQITKAVESLFVQANYVLPKSLEDTIQINNHNGQENYLSLLIDTENFGANLLVYGGLYNTRIYKRKES